MMIGKGVINGMLYPTGLSNHSQSIRDLYRFSDNSCSQTPAILGISNTSHGLTCNRADRVQGSIESYLLPDGNLNLWVGPTRQPGLLEGLCDIPCYRLVLTTPWPEIYMAITMAVHYTWFNQISRRIGHTHN